MRGRVGEAAPGGRPFGRPPFLALPGERFHTLTDASGGTLRRLSADPWRYFQLFACRVLAHCHEVTAGRQWSLRDAASPALTDSHSSPAPSGSVSSLGPRPSMTAARFPSCHQELPSGRRPIGAKGASDEHDHPCRDHPRYPLIRYTRDGVAHSTLHVAHARPIRPGEADGNDEEYDVFEVICHGEMAENVALSLDARMVSPGHGLDHLPVDDGR